MNLFYEQTRICYEFPPFHPFIALNLIVPKTRNKSTCKYHCCSCVMKKSFLELNAEAISISVQISLWAQLSTTLYLQLLLLSVQFFLVRHLSLLRAQLLHISSSDAASYRCTYMMRFNHLV